MYVLWARCVAPACRGAYREAAKALPASICASVHACTASVASERPPCLVLVGVYLPGANFEIVLPAVFDKADHVFVGIAQEKADFVRKLTSANAIAAGAGLAFIVHAFGALFGALARPVLQATRQLIEARIEIAGAIPFVLERMRRPLVDKIRCKFARAIHVDEGSAALPGQNADCDPGV